MSIEAWCQLRRCGGQTLVQDLGRPGFRHLGVSLAGVCDVRAVRAINALVGNPGDAAVLEMTPGGVELHFSEPREIAWAGGDAVVRGGRCGIIPPGRLTGLEGEEILSLGYARSGCRLWLAVSGGFDTPVLMGSQSTDWRSGFGGWQGRSLRPDDRLPLGPAGGPVRPGTRRWGAPDSWVAPSSSEVWVVRGACWEMAGKRAQEAFLGETYQVSQEADRMGVRLEGTALELPPGDRVSEPVVAGTIQVPPSGQPIVLLSDARTMGGYPRLAHVITPHLGRAAQWRPGDAVRFRLVDLAQAAAIADRNERDLAWFQTAVAIYRLRGE